MEKFLKKLVLEVSDLLSIPAGSCVALTKVTDVNLNTLLFIYRRYQLKNVLMLLSITM